MSRADLSRDELERQLTEALAERDQARADLEALRDSLKPGLTPMTAARVEADLVVHGIEEEILDRVIGVRPVWLSTLLDRLDAAKAAAEKIGGAS